VLILSELKLDFDTKALVADTITAGEIEQNSRVGGMGFGSSELAKVNSELAKISSDLTKVSLE
jgi:hypothetical protein